MEKLYSDLKEMVEDEIRRVVKKNDITPAELENLTKAVCLIEKLKMMENGGYSQTGYNNEGMSNMYRNRSYRSDMDSYDRGYSGHSIRDRMIAKLESMYDEAKTDHERQTVDEWINRLSSK